MRLPLVPRTSDNTPPSRRPSWSSVLWTRLREAAAFGHGRSAITSQLAKLSEASRRHMARRGQAELTDASEPETVVCVRLLAANVSDVLGVVQGRLYAGVLQRFERGFPVHTGALQGRRGDGVVKKPVGHCAQAVRRRVELANGDARRPAASLADAHGGGDAHLVDIEAGRTGADHVHVIGAQVDRTFRKRSSWGPLLEWPEAGCGPCIPPSGGSRIVTRPRPAAGYGLGARCRARHVRLKTGTAWPPPVERYDECPASATA